MSARPVTSRADDTKPPSTHSSSPATTPFASKRAKGQGAAVVQVMSGPALGTSCVGSGRAPPQAIGPPANRAAAAIT